VPLRAPPQLNTTWAMDFMGDSLYSGRFDRRLNILNEGNRKRLAIDEDFPLSRMRVVAVLHNLFKKHGAPQQLRCNNAPEFIAEAVRT